MKSWGSGQNLDFMEFAMEIRRSRDVHVAAIKLLLPALLWFVSWDTATAADFSKHSSFNPYGEQHIDYVWALQPMITLSMIGQIRKCDEETLGKRDCDLNRLERLLLELGIKTQYPIENKRVVLFLSSKGGDPFEAIRLAEFLSSKGIGTAIGRQQECSSACALVFMGGSFPSHPEEQTPPPDRWLHVESKLEFHAPSLELGAGDNFPRQTVEYAYDLALRALSKYNSFGDRGDRFPRGLERRMLLKKAGEFYRPDTVDDVGRWRISLYGHANLSNFTYKHALALCDNLYLWHGLRASGEDASDEYVERKIRTYYDGGEQKEEMDRCVTNKDYELCGKLSVISNRLLFHGGPLNNRMSAEHCTVAGQKDKDGRLLLYGHYGDDVDAKIWQTFLRGRISIKKARERSIPMIPVPHWMTFPGGTRLSEIPIRN
jgi:hypothetical protein